MELFPRPGRVALVLDPRPDDPTAGRRLRVVALDGEEALSRLFRFRLELAPEGAPLDDPDRLAGHAAEVRLPGAGGQPGRVIHGMIARAEVTAGGALARVLLVPRAWRLTRRRACRVFHGRHVGQIAAALLDAAGVAHRIRYQDGAPPAAPDHRVQYQESDWDFLRRLLEDEGFTFYFRHEPGRHVLEITDGPDLHPPIEGARALPFRPPAAGEPHDDHVARLALSRELVADRAEVRDYNPDTPQENLAVAAGAAPGDPDTLEVYRHPGGHADARAGEAAARLILERAATRARRVDGEASSPRLLPGHTLTLSGPPLPEGLGPALLVTVVRHRAAHVEALSGPGAAGHRYGCAFRAIPAGVPFRPPRAAPRPRIAGVQTATVCGPPGEIETDARGRVRVRFPWDRRRPSGGPEAGITGGEPASIWVRVSQAFAGAGRGALWIPRAGDEVLVSFLEGDPDRPLVTGRVFNGRNAPPVALPDDRAVSVIASASTPGNAPGNRIAFDDTRGRERLAFTARRDMVQRVVEDLHVTVGRDAHLAVEGKVTERVAGEATAAVGERRAVTVGADDELAVEGRAVVRVGGDARRVVRGKELHWTHRDAARLVGGRALIASRTELSLRAETGVPCSGPDERAGSLTLTDPAAKVDLLYEGRVVLDATRQIQGFAGEAITLDARKIALAAGERLTLTAGGCTIELSGGKISISAPGGIDLTSAAGVKLNG